MTSMRFIKSVCVVRRGKRDDWSGYDSILNVTGKAHADIGILTEEQKQEYYAVNCDLACEAAQKL